VKKFYEKFFSISRVQNVRKQVINFAQGEAEGIDQAWERFNGLIKQGPRIGFSSDVLLHTFYFSLTPECMRYVQMCVGGNIMEKILTEATQLQQRISEGVAVQRYWEEHISGSVEQETCEGPIRRTREGGSEWEPIKILLEGDEDSNKMNTASNTRLRLTTQNGQVHVATGVLLNLGTNTQPSDRRTQRNTKPRIH
jgi:hypothetical protein